MVNKKHIGSKLDNLLEEVGLLEAAEATATKRVLAYQMQVAMKEEGVSKIELAKRMKTSRSSLDRFLDDSNTSVTLRSMEKAAFALGKSLKVELVDRPA